jgi:hypothetical protein
METLIALFGEGKDLDSLQMAARPTAVFFGALVLIRISGRRSFGQRSPFDYVVAILLGATLSRVIVGEAYSLCELHAWDPVRLVAAASSFLGQGQALETDRSGRSVPAGVRAGGALTGLSTGGRRYSPLAC